MRRALSSEVPRATIASSSDGNAASATTSSACSGNAATATTATTSEACAGNAASATVLETPRGIDGVAFDGSIDIRTGPCILSTITGINAKVVATTDLYTVPVGKTAIITDAIIRVTALDTLTVAPDMGIGRNATQDDIFASATLTGLDALTKRYSFAVPLVAAIAAATEVIKLGVDTGATATTMTIAVDLVGYLL